MTTHVSTSPRRNLRAPDPISAVLATAWLRAGLRWFALSVVGTVITLAVLATILHPSPVDFRELALFLVIGSLVSLALGAGALWLVDAVQFGGIRLKMAIPPLLTALIIAFNVTLISRMMFISTEDGQLQLAFLSFGALLALLLAASIGGRVVSAVRHIEAGALRIAEGDYSYRLTVRETAMGATELAQLAACFNQMAASVETSFERQKLAEAERRHVVAALSHDLRTPLASVRAMVEAIDDGVVSDPATVGRYQHSIRSEVQHLSLLLDDLFELSKLESGAYPLELDRVALEDVLSDAVEAVREQAEQAGLTISGCIAGPLPTVTVDARQIHRVLLNLLQNSLRHTPTGGTIEVRAEVEQGAQSQSSRHIVVRVLDSGEGITPRDLVRVFEPTYRGERSRTRTKSAIAPERSGLGLAIARHIIEVHGGCIQARSPVTDNLQTGLSEGVELPGTEVLFTLPVRE